MGRTFLREFFRKSAFLNFWRFPVSWCLVPLCLNRNSLKHVLFSASFFLWFELRWELECYRLALRALSLLRSNLECWKVTFFEFLAMIWRNFIQKVENLWCHLNKFIFRVFLFGSKLLCLEFLDRIYEEKRVLGVYYGEQELSVNSSSF